MDQFEYQMYKNYSDAKKMMMILIGIFGLFLAISAVYISNEVWKVVEISLESAKTVSQILI